MLAQPPAHTPNDSGPDEAEERLHSGERPGAGEMNDGGLGGLAIEVCLADPGSTSLTGVQGQGNALVGKDSVCRPRPELSAPGLPAGTLLGDRQLNLDLTQVFAVAALNACH